MNGVSCRALGLVIDGVKSGQLSLDRLLEGLSPTPQFISVPSNRISWDDFTAIMERLESELGGPAALRRFGEDSIKTATFSVFLYVGRALSLPRDIYFMGARWMGPSLFPMTHADIRELPNGTIVQRLTIADGHRDCPALFHTLHGSMATAPALLGHGRSRVSLDLSPRCATFTIHPPITKAGWTRKAFRAIRARIAVPSMLRELEEQQSALGENYDEIQEAHDRIATQAADLSKVNSIGGRLSEHIDLNRVSDILIRIMLDELAIAGVEISLRRTEIHPQTGSYNSTTQSRFVRQGGRREGPATKYYLLEAAGRPLGGLSVWRNDDDLVSQNSALLERLIPWIAMALDNARTYEALERHAAALEERVNERTARLLAANHHLVREIDERQRATDALVESQAQLHASERLASIGTLAAGIAHEINNPVGSILAAAQLAQIVRNDPSGEAQVTDSLETIVMQAKRCGEIVSSVLQFSRDEPTRKWTSEINDVVRRSIKLTEAFAREHAARFIVDLPESSAWANVNPIQIEQAVVNLIRNAIEAGARRIDVSVREEPHEQLVMIEVGDDGPGLAASDRLRIFEPFYTTKQSIGGTGLGLSVVHGIAVEHGGSLRIDDGHEAGTTIVLELPTCPPPPNPLEEKPDGLDQP